MKVQELFGVLDITQKIAICNKKEDGKTVYEGIVAGCYKEYKAVDVVKVKIQDDLLKIDVDCEVEKEKELTNDELLAMYFDESELGMDLEEMEKNLTNMISGLNDFKFDFE